MSEDRTEINTLGEFGLIERIKSGVKQVHKETIKGIDDDAAVIDAKDHYYLFTTDMFIEGTHFDLSYFPLHHLGYKVAVANFSDIAAMNGIPRQMTISLGLSNRFSVEAIDVLYQGIAAACKNYKVDLVGGDTSSSSSGLIISVSVLGQVDKGSVAYRSGANDNDIICVTGDLGGSYLGLQVLEREKQVFLTNPEMQPDLEKYDYIVQRQLKPEARTDIIHELKEMEVLPTSMIDISDGLGSELLHICKHSGTGARVYEDKLPYDPMTFKVATEFKIDISTCMLNGGEDYELLFTISQDDFEKLKNHRDIHMIGYITREEEQPVLISKDGNVIPIQAQGWDHFKENNQSSG